MVAIGNWHTSIERVEFPFLLLDRNRDEIESFLTRDVPRNLYQLSWLQHWGVEANEDQTSYHFRGIREERDQLSAVSLIISNRLFMLDALNQQCAEVMGRWCRKKGYQLSHIVSAKEVVSPFWETYSGNGQHAVARLRQSQVMLKLDPQNFPDTEFEPVPPLRLAKESDFKSLMKASAQMQREETLQDPRKLQPETFKRQIRQRIDANRSYVWCKEDKVIFKIDISASGDFGVQISGVYTAPEWRGKGVATRGLAQLCRTLFANGRQLICLYVNNENKAAKAVYKKLGFKPHCDYETIYVE